MRDLELYDILELDGKTITFLQYKELRNNKCYIYSNYLGETNFGNSMYNIELIHNNDIDVFVME